MDGQYYVFTVPAFGLVRGCSRHCASGSTGASASVAGRGAREAPLPHLNPTQAPAPRWYTEAMVEVYRLVRKAGARLTFMIDDQANWASSEALAKEQCEAMVRLLAALGFYLRPDKCQLRPVQLLKFLGLMVDSAAMKFWVPPDRLQRFAAKAVRLLQPFSTVTDRQLASLAGKLLSFSLAVDIAPLLARGLYHAMVGRSRWDESRLTSQELWEQLQWCTHLLLRFNGTRMIKRDPSLILVGDASDVGAGGELQHCMLWLRRQPARNAR